MHILKRYWFFAIPLAVIVSFLILDQAGSLFQEKEIRKMIKKRDSIYREWKAAVYTKIERNDDFEEKVKEAVLKQNTAKILSTQQRESLSQSVINLIYAHSEGTWKSFRAFRIPIDDQYVIFDRKLLKKYKSNYPSSRSEALKQLKQTGQESTDPQVQELLKKYPHLRPDLHFEKVFPFFDVSSPLKVYETHWRFYVNYTFYAENGKPLYCTRCWKSLALESFQLSVLDIPKEEKVFPSYFQMGTNAVRGVQATGYPRSLVFQPSVQQLHQNGSILVAYVSFLMQNDREENPQPVHASYYWATQHNQWLPMEITLVGQPKARAFKYFF